MNESTSAAALTTATKDRLIGFWHLRSWLNVYPDAHSEPYSAKAIGGFLHYASDGTMAVSIFERDGGLVLTTYGGRYEVIGNEVVHYPSEGYSPTGTQAPKRRYISVSDHELSLSTAWIESAMPTHKFRLEWTKSA